jgi:formyl-CoA transferase
VPFTDGSSLTVDSPFWIAGQEKVRPRRAPDVGAHSDEVLRAADYSDAEITALRADGVIG